MKIKKIGILGSTGSIGTQTLEIIRANKEDFDVQVLSTNKNIDLLTKQIDEFSPKLVCISDQTTYSNFKTRYPEINIVNCLEDIFDYTNLDLLVTAIVGSAGLKPTLKAIENKIDIALANKETLVMAGKIVMQKAQENDVNILPVDSEHSAIWQSLKGNNKNEVSKIHLTCSGGPFRGKNKSFLENVTLQDALNHPTWTMGGKITIDSATLMNKGLEVIEAYHLFDVSPDNIEVVIHPESIIHSMVEYLDGNIIAQLGPPDMRLPIQYAMYYPNRVINDFKRVNFFEVKSLHFQKPDLGTFIPLKLAYKSIELGGIMPAVLNASNEILVNAFLKEKIKFIDIFEYLEKIFCSFNNITSYTINDLIQADFEARVKTEEILNS